MDNRKQSILQALIEDYIQSGTPISSGYLANKYSSWNVSSATIRNELLALSEEGFLLKPHTSSGRVPTAKGYRFFVDNVVERLIQEEHDKALIFSGSQTFFDISEVVAKEVHSLVLMCEDAEHVYEIGLEYLLDEPEFKDRDFLADFLRCAQYLRRDFKKLIAFINSHPHLYIGEEAKELVGDERYTFLITRVARQGYVAFLGSTRIDYKKGLALAYYLNSQFYDE